MKKLLVLITIILFSNSLIAQEKLYLVFEFMKVDNEQEAAYMETEAFWEKIQQQRVKNGDILGWDLWVLQPGGEDQGYQYFTVNVYNNAVKMFSNAGDFNAALKAAYPKMTEAEIEKKMTTTSASRDLAVRIYLEKVAGTKSDFEMPLGTVAAINMMKVSEENYENYEKAEAEFFGPVHQKDVNAGRRADWQLLRYMSPSGSDVYASHITVDMYKDYNQLFNGNGSPDNEPEWTAEEIKKANDGVALRDLKYRYMATLIKKVR